VAKRALLIGVNKYKIHGADLRGCVNDVEDLAEALVRFCGFPASGIRTVLDGRATKARMVSEIKKITTSAKPGDSIVIHFSGHGSNVPDKNGDEADKRDEILCPTNLDWRDPLTDDWMRIVIDKVAPRVNTTVIFDCCHSGTATRAFEPPDAKVKERYLACPLDLMAAESGRGMRGRLKSKRRRKKRVAKRDVVHVNIPEVLITGCRDNQTSADARIRGRFNGAMTYSLVRALKWGKGKLTYRKLHAAMRAYLKGKYTQVPQLEGRAKNLDRQVFT
jgi:hypothetical protein